MDTRQRNREIFALREIGRSYSWIGIKFGLSKERIRQIYKNEKAHVEAENAHQNAIAGNIAYTFWDALCEVCDSQLLVTRIYRCLSRAGILNAMIKNNWSLDEYDDDTLLCIRNFGNQSLMFSRKANELYKEKRLKIANE